MSSNSIQAMCFNDWVRNTEQQRYAQNLDISKGAARTKGLLIQECRWLATGKTHCPEDGRR